jgi:hypothetical protein
MIINGHVLSTKNEIYCISTGNYCADEFWDQEVFDLAQELGQTSINCYVKATGNFWAWIALLYDEGFEIIWEDDKQPVLDDKKREKLIQKMYEVYSEVA